MSYIKQKSDEVPADNLQGTISPNQVAFGDPDNSGKIKGSDNFIFVDESGGSGPTVEMTGDKPVLKLKDDTAATDYRTELQQSGASLYVNHKDSTGTNNELLRLASGTVIVNDDTGDIDFRVAGTSSQSLLRTNAAQNNVGIGTNPSSDVEGLHVKGTGADDTMVRLESTDTDTDAGPVLDLYRNSGAAADNDLIGKITFSGNDSGGAQDNLATIKTVLRDNQAGSEDGTMIFEVKQFGSEAYEFLRMGLDPGQTNRQVIVNNGNGVVGFLVKGANTAIMQTLPTTNTFQVNPYSNAAVDMQVKGTASTILQTDASQNNVGIGAAPDSGVERLHVKGTGTGTLVKLESTGTGGAGAPDLVLHRNNPSPSANDDIGEIKFNAENSNGDETNYATIYAEIPGITPGSEAGRLRFYLANGAGGQNEIFRINSNTFIVNELDENIDFRVEGQSNPNLIVTDASNDNVGIGTFPDSGVERLHVKGTGLTDMVVFEGTSEGSGATDGPDLILYNSATPTGPNKFIGRLEWRGKNDAGTAKGYGSIQTFIQDDTASTEDSLMLFKTFTGGSALEKLRLNLGGTEINSTGNDSLDFNVKTGSTTQQQSFFRGYNSSTIEERYTEVLRGSKVASSTPVSVAASYCYGSNIVIKSGASVINLPEAIPGMHLQIVNTNISGVSVAPASAETINGSTSAYSIHHGWVIAKLICYQDGGWVIAEAF